MNKQVAAVIYLLRFFKSYIALFVYICIYICYILHISNIYIICYIYLYLCLSLYICVYIVEEFKNTIGKLIEIIELTSKNELQAADLDFLTDISLVSALSFFNRKGWFLETKRESVLTNDPSASSPSTVNTCSQTLFLQHIFSVLFHK